MGDEKDRRQGKIDSAGDILSGKQGRKVFTGVWVLIFANIWFGCAVMGDGHGLSEKGYLIMSLSGVLLIGFGTILDTFVSDLGHKIVDVAGMVIGSRVGAFTTKIEKTTEAGTTSIEVTKPSA